LITAKILFNCKVAVCHKGKIHIIDRKLADEYGEESYHHYDSFEATVYDCSEYESNEPIGYYSCNVYLVYETIEYCGGQNGTEYDSYLEFEEFIKLA
jgi:hypothetical protein